MTLAEIRTLAECSRGAGNPIVDRLADFAVATIDAMTEQSELMPPFWAQQLYLAVFRNMEKLK